MSELKAAEQELVSVVNQLLCKSGGWKHTMKHGYPRLEHPRGVSIAFSDRGRPFAMYIKGVNDSVSHEDLIIDKSKHDMSGLISKAEVAKAQSYRVVARKLLKPTLGERVKAWWSK